MKLIQPKKAGLSMTNDRRPYSMTNLEYRLLKEQWTGEDNHILFVDTAERCLTEGWTDHDGQITHKGRIAVSLYETFKTQWDDDEDYFDNLADDIPWKGDSVYLLDHYRLSDSPVAKAVAKAAPVDASPAANDTETKEPPVATRGNGHLAAPEEEEPAYAESS